MKTEYGITLLGCDGDSLPGIFITDKPFNEINIRDVIHMASNQVGYQVAGVRIYKIKETL